MRDGPRLFQTGLRSREPSRSGRAQAHGKGISAPRGQLNDGNTPGLGGIVLLYRRRSGGPRPAPQRPAEGLTRARGGY